MSVPSFHSLLTSAFESSQHEISVVGVLKLISSNSQARVKIFFRLHEKDRQIDTDNRRTYCNWVFKISLLCMWNLLIKLIETRPILNLFIPHLVHYYCYYYIYIYIFIFIHQWTVERMQYIQNDAITLTTLKYSATVIVHIWRYQQY